MSPAPKNMIVVKTTKNKKKNKNKRSRKGYLSTLSNKVISPLPQRYICKMKYAEYVTTSTTGYYGFRLNSVYDPNYSGTGHQPYGFDQLAAIYNRYRVIACGWRVTVTPSTASNSQIGIIPTNEVHTVADFDKLKESPRARYALIAAGGNAYTLTGKSYLPSLTGRTRAQYMADDRYQALNNADPQEQMMLNILTAGSDSIMASRNVQVLLEYTVEFFDPNILPQS